MLEWFDMDASTNTSPEDPLQGASIRKITMNGRVVELLVEDAGTKLRNFLDQPVYGEGGIA